MIALFDHEEVGSTSSPGAGSSLMRDALVRISDCLNEGTLARSRYALISHHLAMIVRVVSCLAIGIANLPPRPLFPLPGLI